MRSTMVGLRTMIATSLLVWVAVCTAGVLCKDMHLVIRTDEQLRKLQNADVKGITHAVEEALIKVLRAAATWHQG